MNADVYCDGSGSVSGPAGIGFVAKVGDDGFYEGSLPLANGTNQKSEILAAAYGLDQIDACDHVFVYSDSEYVVKGMELWIQGWIRRGWRTKSGSPVKNQREWRRLLIAVEKHTEVEFRWVRGHDGNEMNERADELAGLARARAIDDALTAGSF